MNAFNKYGEESFRFDVLIICFDEDLYDYEKEYILKYNSFSPNGYNADEGGEFGGNFKGRKHTEESKNKISNAVSGSNNGFYNKQHTEETKLLLRTIKEKNTIKNLRNVIITKEAESIIDGILISL
jgi:group I intron endonuclease